MRYFHAYFSQQYPGAPSSPITSLFVGGTREIRAKYPNGDPLIPGGGGWGGKATGGSKFAAGAETSGTQFPWNVKIVSAGGLQLSQGSSLDGKPATYTLHPPGKCSARRVREGGVSVHAVYVY